jgi:hypothetical protein
VKAWTASGCDLEQKAGFHLSPVSGELQAELGSAAHRACIIRLDSLDMPRTAGVDRIVR